MTEGKQVELQEQKEGEEERLVTTEEEKVAEEAVVDEEEEEEEKKEEEEEEEEEEELKIPFYYPLLNKIPWVNNWFPKEPTKEQMIGHRIKVSLFNIGHFILWFFWAFFHTIYFHDTKAEGFMYRHKVLNRSLSGLAQCTVAFILFYSVLAGFMFTNLLLLSYGLYGNPQFNLINYSNSY